MEPLPRTWLIMASLPRSWLAFAQSCMAMASLPRSWQDHGKIMARSWQGYQGTCHGSWQGCHGFEHWESSKYLHSYNTLLLVNFFIQEQNVLLCWGWVIPNKVYLGG